MEGCNSNQTPPHRIQSAGFLGSPPGIPTTQVGPNPAEGCPQEVPSMSTTQAFGMIASMIEQNPHFIGELYGFLARFMPLPLSPNGTQLLTASSEGTNDIEWQLAPTGRKRRRGPETSGGSKQATPTQLDQLPTQTVVLRSVGKKEVGTFTGKEIKEAIERAGVQPADKYTIRRNEKANAISIMTKNPLCLDKLLQVKEIRKGDEVHLFQPYKALSENQCRGVIYLKGQGNDVAPESLMAEIHSSTSTIVAARPLGRKGNTILMT
ncbi:unnamed protein product, partial [Ixodes hexagonus]